jgi:phosphoribosylanthranilate isomerase
MNIKVCGITQIKQLQQLDGLNIDFAGLIFHPSSPRNVDGKIDAEQLKDSVFKDAEMIDILTAIDDYGLDVVQLHGEESTEMCADLSEEVEVIKAFSISSDTDDIDALIAPYDEVCDYYLFDTKTADGATGGTGKKFDWKKLLKAKIEKPFFLSGGISLADIDAIKKIKHPDFYGIDVNSQFEKEPGVKDMALVLKLKQELKW